MNYKFHCLVLSSLFTAFACNRDHVLEPVASPHDLVFSDLASRWDEAIPLGNGWLGALVWQKGRNLRFSLDRADLWDLRPMPNLHGPEFRFRWVIEQWRKGRYRLVQKRFDEPYTREPAPGKIPAGALEVADSSWGAVSQVHLYLNQAVCALKWKNGVKMLTFVSAEKPVGWFRLENLPESPRIFLKPPPYAEPVKREENLSRDHLRWLGYPKGDIQQTTDHIVYEQPGWNGFHYRVSVRWQHQGRSLIGCWSISSHFPGKRSTDADQLTDETLAEDWDKAFAAHASWWQRFWAKSAIDLPDEVLEDQWYRELYKFGSTARSDAPPISLQAVWTADNGRIPPWKGDFHHDLNTQLSYWPAYSANHLTEELGFLNWLWDHRDTFREYTRTYFGVAGLNVPGVTTLDGKPMGGWIQYSFGPTVAAWLAHHFYLHWRYSMDKEFLLTRAYPWLRDVAVYLEGISEKDTDGKRKLPLSSSPEFFNNSPEAWFFRTTNFDLALIRWTYQAAAEMADSLKLPREAAHWRAILQEWPELAVDDRTGLLLAPEHPYVQSHRHFSHLMAIHPLGLIDWSQGSAAREVICNSLRHLQELGSEWWVGYSFSWLGNLLARARDGNGAAQALKTFAECFCLPNSFHVNGDQSGTGKSRFTYRPFTLEGNFAFAAGVQEMLLQSHTDTVRVFPAVPDDWRDVAFTNLRAQGAFLISAKMQSGQVKYVSVLAEKGGLLRLANTFSSRHVKVVGGKLRLLNEQVIELKLKVGEKVVLQATGLYIPDDE